MDERVRGRGIDVEGHRDSILELLQSLIALQPQGEAAVQARVAERLEAAGAIVERLDYEPSEVPVVAEFAALAAVNTGQRTSLVGRIEGGQNGRSVILFAHPDGEPIGDTSDWQRDPFAGVIDNGRLYGWGVADDLAGVAAAVSAMTLIKAADIRLGGDVHFASTPSKRHARGVAALLHHGLTADAAIYLHPAESGVGMNEIKAFASGQLQFSVKVTGKLPETTEPGHTAFSHLAINPLAKAIKLMEALVALDALRGEAVHHPLLDAAIGRSTNILLSSVQFGRQGVYSRVPGTLTFGGSVSFPPSETMSDVQAQIEAALETVVAGDTWLSDNPPVVTWISGVTGAEVPQTHPLYRAVAQAVSDAGDGMVPHVNPMHTSSDIRNPMVQKGIPTVGFGPLAGDLTQTGRHDEWVDVEDYLRFVAAVANSIVAWCGVEA